MNILVTGAKGFIGRNVVANLNNIKDGKNCTSNFVVDSVFEYDIDTDPALLDEYFAKANFVFNLAGVNRPKKQSEFLSGNFDFASSLLDALKKHNNTCPVIEFEVSGDKIQAIHMLLGYTYNIINLSETENLVTVMWANE